MLNTKKFSELRAQMSPEARAEARRLADDDLKEMPLHELRAGRLEMYAVFPDGKVKLGLDREAS